MESVIPVSLRGTAIFTSNMNPASKNSVTDRGEELAQDKVSLT